MSKKRQHARWVSRNVPSREPLLTGLVLWGTKFITQDIVGNDNATSQWFMEFKSWVCLGEERKRALPMHCCPECLHTWKKLSLSEEQNQEVQGGNRLY